MGRLCWGVDEVKCDSSVGGGGIGIGIESNGGNGDGDGEACVRDVLADLLT